MASGKRVSNWYIAGLVAFVVLFLLGLQWFVNVPLDWALSKLGGGSSLDLGYFNKIIKWIIVATILLFAWFYVWYSLNRKLVWIIVYVILAALVILGLIGVGGFSII